MRRAGKSSIASDWARRAAVIKTSRSSAVITHKEEPPLVQGLFYILYGRRQDALRFVKKACLAVHNSVCIRRLHAASRERRNQEAMVSHTLMISHFMLNEVSFPDFHAILLDWLPE